MKERFDLRSSLHTILQTLEANTFEKKTTINLVKHSLKTDCDYPVSHKLQRSLYAWIL